MIHNTVNGSNTYDPLTGYTTYSVYVDLNNAGGGAYALTLSASAYAVGYLGATGTADFGSTVRIVGLTTTDGAAVAGATFESGYEISGDLRQAPEPGTLGMLALGAVGLVGYRRRRLTTGRRALQAGRCDCDPDGVKGMV